MFIINIYFIIIIKMAGGIVQIATYGTQDIYLTGSPEITFFKIVYRRHTQFAIESVRLTFDDEIGFDEISTINIPKNGDLLYRMYLEFDIPSVHLRRVNKPDMTIITQELENAKQDFNNVNDFILYNMILYREALNIYEADNSTINDIIDAINNVYNNNTIPFDKNDQDSEITKFINLLDNLEGSEFATYKLNKIFIKDVSDNFDISKGKEIFMNILNRSVEKMKIIQKYYFDILYDKENEYDDKNSPYSKFAWTRRLGHALIDYCEIEIGGYVIDRLYGDWINIWNELTLSDNHSDNYSKLIGDVPELYTFDRNEKPSFKVKVPLLFWFNRFNGLALPLIALENNDVIFRLKTRSLDKIAQIEPETEIKVEGIGEGLNIYDLEQDEQIVMDINLYADYIFLNSDERKRFAQVSNEYLIEHHQVNDFENISKENYEIELDFLHPCRHIVWFVRKQSYINNNDEGSKKLQWDNYTANENKKNNPILETEIFFHGQKRTEIKHSKYYNYIQPDIHFLRTPDDGVNVYSFALKPYEYQPNGSCNLSRLTSFKMKFLFDSELFKDDDMIDLRVIATTNNILRFAGGHGALAFSNR